MRNAAERQQLINDRKRPVTRKERLWVRDSWREFDVFQVPVEALVLNVDNRRFRAEKGWAEEKLSRPLDPENQPDDERAVESLLLDKAHRIEGGRIIGDPSEDYESLKNDWLRRGQESPFWIRPDGTVRNGNRRLAMIKRQQREGGDTGLQWIEAVLLDPSDIDEPALLEMEQREQLTENLKVRYNDINYLLALREAAVNRDIDWFDRESIDQAAGELQTMVEKSKAEVLRDLYAIKYMDAFLDDAALQGKYHTLLRTLERFRDIGRMMIYAEVDYPLESARILQVLFAAVRSGKTHDDIRALRRMFREDRRRFDQLASDIEAIESQSSATNPPNPVPPPAPNATEEDDSDEEGEGPGPEVANYPRSQVRRSIGVAIDGFRAAREADVLSILREIRNRLDVLSDGERLQQALHGGDAAADSVRAEYRAIIEWIDSHRELEESS